MYLGLLFIEVGKIVGREGGDKKILLYFVGDIFVDIGVGVYRRYLGCRFIFGINTKDLGDEWRRRRVFLFRI